MKYLFFWGHTNRYKEAVGKFCFSQWYECPFTVDNVTYRTAEHWMMAQKALLFNDRNVREKIIACDKPVEAKAFGRQVSGYEEQTWNERKFDIVKLGNIHKFNQHPALAAYLLKTENKIFVEASPVDTIWGIGLSQDSKDIENIYAWRGQNLLGFALMAARDFLKEFGHFKPLEEVVQAPWIKYPLIDKSDLFWRMGEGEEYLVFFQKYINNLSDRDKTIYQLTHPEPDEWAGFFD